jgi:predicted Zn-dependent protease
MSSRVDRFQQLVDKDPGNELYRFSLAQALQSDGRNGEAIIQYQVCVDRKSDWMMPRILLGKLLLAEGRPAEARPVLDDALKLAIEQHHEDPERELRELLAEISEA